MSANPIDEDYTISFRQRVIASGSRPTTVSPTSTKFGERTIFDSPDPDNPYYFGTSVFVSGSRIVSTAPGLSDGRAYIYNLIGSSWVNTATLSGSHLDTDGDLAFGGRAIDETSYNRSCWIRGNRILIGAGREERNNDSQYIGAAYMFTSASEGWGRTRLQVTGASSTSIYGYGASVLLADDFFAIGHPNEFQDLAYENTGNAQGVIFTYNYGETDGNNYVQILTSSHRGNASYPGFGTAMAYDYKNRLLVTSQATSPERVEVFASSSTKGWNVTQTIINPAGATTRFGQSVDCFDDYLIIGSHRSGSGFSGAAYIYKYAESQYSLEKLIEGTLSNQELGRSVSITSGAIGGVTAAIGSELENDEGMDGMVYIYHSSSVDGWIAGTTLKSISTNTAAGLNSYGLAVYIDQDNLAVGSYEENTKGRTYIYDPATTGVETDPIFRFGSRGAFNLRLQGSQNPYRTFVGNENK